MVGVTSCCTKMVSTLKMVAHYSRMFSTHHYLKSISKPAPKYSENDFEQSERSENPNNMKAVRFQIWNGDLAIFRTAYLKSGLKKLPLLS